MTKKAKPTRKAEADLLHDWGTLNRGLMSLQEHQVQDLLERERAGQNRQGFLLRIHARLNKLRRQRETRELLGPTETK